MRKTDDTKQTKDNSTTQKENKIDHDQLFKQLILFFFEEFIRLFFPNFYALIDFSTLSFLPHEYYTDILTGERKLLDLVAKVKLLGRDVFFIIHNENQEKKEEDFSERMYCYNATLFLRYRLKIFPIAILSYKSPLKPENNTFDMTFEGINVTGSGDFNPLHFEYYPLQLNRMDWRKFLDNPNPVASALMAKMKIATKDRPKVKAECLRMLVTLKLAPARTKFISGFIDSYLNLNAKENVVF